MVCWYPAKCITTAPTWTQVENILWTEIRQAYASARFRLGGKLLKTEWQLDDGWFATGISTNAPASGRDFGTARMQGYHSPNLLVLIDEAAGIESPIWKAIGSLTTGANNKVLAIGNPAVPVGPFFDTFSSQIWHKIKVSCLDHPNVVLGREVIPGAVTSEWVADARAEYGEGSQMWKAKVLGDFPDEGTDTLIPLSWVERAVNREMKDNEPWMYAIDVARHGNDSTVHTIMKGRTVKAQQTYNGKDLMSTVGRAQENCHKYGKMPIAPDDTGLGGGVTDRLKELEYEVVPINFGERALESHRFYNKKAELFWKLRCDFENDNISIPDDPELIQQLSSILYDFTSTGIKIESKDDMKKRGMKSPDKADSLAIANGAGMYQQSFTFDVF